MVPSFPPAIFDLPLALGRDMDHDLDESALGANARSKRSVYCNNVIVSTMVRIVDNDRLHVLRVFT